MLIANKKAAELYRVKFTLKNKTQLKNIAQMTSMLDALEVFPLWKKGDNRYSQCILIGFITC